MKSLLSDMTQQIMPKLDAQQVEWLSHALDKLSKSQNIDNDLLFYSTVVRRTFSDNRHSITFNVNAEKLQFTMDVAVRGLLICLAIQLTTEQSPQTHDKTTQTIVKNYYQFGDEHEKCALLSMLSIIDPSGAALATAIKSCRCNSVLEFTSIALNNPYPADNFPQLNLNQLVLKSLFMGLDISLIPGLSRVKNHALSNMCFAYAIEQALAERIPPATLWLAVELDDLEGENLANKQKYLDHFKQVSPEHYDQINAQFNAIPTS